MESGMEFVTLAFGMVLGIVGGVLMTPFIDRISEHRRRLNLLRHISYDLKNAKRHYSYVRDELKLLKSEDQWRRISRLSWMMFPSRGFFTFPKHDLFVLKSEESDPFNELIVLMSNFDLLCKNLRQLEFADVTRDAYENDQFNEYHSELSNRVDEVVHKLARVNGLIESAITKWKWV